MSLPCYPLSATAYTFKCSTTRVKKQVSLNTTLTGFGLFPFRSPLLRECVRKNEQFFLFLRVLRCFNSPGYPHTPMNSVYDNLIFHQVGFPHSEIHGSKVACHLTEAYRRLLRPSSSLHIEASTICPYLFNHKNYRNIFYPMCN